MIKETAGQVMKLVDDIDRLPDLGRANIERLLGVRLAPSPDDPGVWRAALPAGPFAEVVLQEPGPGQARGRYNLGLRVKEGTTLPLQAFPDELLGPIVDINPRIPPEGTVARGVQGDGRDRVLEFWAGSQLLRQASFHREAGR